MCDKKCGSCIYFLYPNKGNWARSGICKPPSGIKYNKDFFNEICDEFSSKPNLDDEHDDDEEDNNFSKREINSFLANSLRSI